MSHLICDFCSDSPVTWRYPAQTFIAYETAGLVGQSVGDWAACNGCYELIQSGNREQLLERSLQNLIANNPDLSPVQEEIRQQIAHFHRLFFTYQTGAPVAVV